MSPALDESARLAPDVLVLDISMPVLNGIEAARRLTAAGSAAKIVFLTVNRDVDSVRAALAAGALGYVIKDRLVADLPVALSEALAGRSFVSPCVSIEQGTRMAGSARPAAHWPAPVPTRGEPRGPTARPE